VEKRKVRRAAAALIALAAGVSRADAQDSTFYDLGELTRRGQRSVLTTPTVSVIDTSPDADAQVVMYRVVWRPVVDVSGTWQPTPAPPIEGPWLYTEVGEAGSGLPARSGEFLDAETREPITSHHADLPPDVAHLVQAELRWFPAGSAQFVHQEVRALQVLQGSGAQPPPSLVAPNVAAAPRVRLARDLAPSGLGLYVAPGLVLTSARAVAGRAAVLVARGDDAQQARVVAVDADLDLALLEHTMDAPPLPFRRDPPRPGERVERVDGALVDATGRIVGVGAHDARAVLGWLQARGVMPTVTSAAGPGRALVERASVRVYAP
jgi:hypothetical protein